MSDFKEYVGYFARPFPRTGGFSAYRFPGMFVHIPLFFIFLYLGFYLNWETPALRPFMLLYLILGIYVSRDIAIYAHYMPLLILAVLAVLIFSPSLVKGVLMPLKASLGSAFPTFAMLVDIAALVAFVWYVRHWVKKGEV
jgi:hypothetical protein